MSAVNDHLYAINNAIGRADNAKSMANVNMPNTLLEAEKLIQGVRDGISPLPWASDEEFQDIIEKADDILDEFKTEARSAWLVGAIGDLVSDLEALRSDLMNG